MKSLSTRRLISLLSAAAFVAALAVATLPAAASAATCAPTGFVRDGINMTAAQIGGNVTGSLDATGCNIGVYYGPLYDSGTTYPVTQGNVTGQAPSGNVTGATISGANYFGVVVNGDVGTVAVNVTNGTIRNIGEVPFNGTQHGIAIYYRAMGTGTASGTISGNIVTDYQKNGITTVGSVSSTITNNTVTGLGRVDYIGQNGIEVGYGATATVTGNTVTGNAYTGTNNASSTGILFFGGACYGSAFSNGLISKNTLTNNDIGVYVFNGDASCNTPTTKTNAVIKLNTITNAAITNVSGNGYPCGYQTGITDFGFKDQIVNNTISGVGYTAPGPGCTFLAFIDTDASHHPGISSNK